MRNDRRVEQGTTRFKPVRPVSAYEVVVDHLRRALQLGRFIPGEKLPPERELALQLEISRTTLRQAIRVLEGEGLIECRRGATGGIVVLPQKYSDRQVQMLMTERIPQIEHLYDFRLTIEVATARQAAAHRTEKDVASLAQSLGVMDEVMADPAAMLDAHHVARFLAADSDFHTGIAAASGNPYLEAAVEEIRSAKFLPIGAVFSKLDEDANDGHRTMFEAIVAGDAERAGEEMRRHVEHTRNKVRAVVQADLAHQSLRKDAGLQATETP